MPQIGEIQIARNIGYVGTSKFIWSPCIDCGRERWVQCLGGRAVSRRCMHCCNSGSRSSSWKGGKRKASLGYRLILLKETDFFYPMAQSNGYILEHRLVMARHLRRHLHSWEIVHHKNHIRDDNRIENLQLVSGDKHLQFGVMERKVKHLEKKVMELKEQLREAKDGRKERRQVAQRTKREGSKER